MSTLSKADCGRVVSREEYQKKLLEMLDAFAKFCEEHNLRYYLSGGTLLGAIRHRGFIPWDDDIDLMMPRPDFEKLCAIVGDRIGRYYVSRPCDGRFQKSTQWLRLYDEEFIIENAFGGASKKQPFYVPLFEDVFPIDGFPAGKVKTRLFSMELKALKKMLDISWFDHVVAKNSFKKLLFLMAWVPAKMVGLKNWSRIFQHEAKKYDFERAEYIGVTTTTQYLPREKVKKEGYLKAIKVPFEGGSYAAPAGYDIYLSQLYGDYMKLPPENKRGTHHDFTIYERKAARQKNGRNYQKTGKKRRTLAE